MTTLKIIRETAQQLNATLAEQAEGRAEVRGATENKYSSLEHNNTALVICLELLTTLNKSIVNNPDVDLKTRQAATDLSIIIFKLSGDLEQRIDAIKKFGEDPAKKMNLDDLISKTKFLQDCATQAEALLPKQREGLRFAKAGEPKSDPVVSPRKPERDLRRSFSMPKFFGIGDKDTDAAPPAKPEMTPRKK